MNATGPRRWAWLGARVLLALAATAMLIHTVRTTPPAPLAASHPPEPGVPSTRPAVPSASTTTPNPTPTPAPGKPDDGEVIEDSAVEVDACPPGDRTCAAPGQASPARPPTTSTRPSSPSTPDLSPSEPEPEPEPEPSEEQEEPR